MLPFIKKYQPKTLSDIKGQDAAINQLKYFISNFKKQNKKACLIYGPSGCGKTSSIYVLGKEFNYEVYEINASDVRNKEQIDEKVGSAVYQKSLFSQGKIILIDEVDGLSGTKDRGGLPAIIKILQETAFPIILTIQNPWDNKFSSLRSKTQMTEFQPLTYLAIYEVLKDICKKENIVFQEDVLKSLARRSGNDCRAAINDLQTLSFETKELTKESLEELSQRNKEDTIINALLKIFKTTDPKIALTAFENVREDLDEQLLWLDENLPKEYTKPKDLAQAYDKLSKADVFNRRIRRWQHWRFLVYINELITAGIALSKDEKYKHMVQYKPTGKLLKIWWANQKLAKKKAIAQKIAEKTHASTKEIIKDIPYYQIIFQKNRQMAKEITEELELSAEEVEWLRK